MLSGHVRLECVNSERPVRGRTLKCTSPRCRHRTGAGAILHFFVQVGLPELLDILIQRRPSV